MTGDFEATFLVGMYMMNTRVPLCADIRSWPRFYPASIEIGDRATRDQN